MDAASRGALRQSESAPILAAFKDQLLAWRDQLLPKHPMAQAINYVLNGTGVFCFEVLMPQSKSIGVPVEDLNSVSVAPDE